MSKLGLVFTGSVMLYLKKVVEPLENTFYFYMKKTVRHYGAYSTSTKTQTRYYNDVYQSLVTYAAAKLEDLVEFSSTLQSVKFN